MGARTAYPRLEQVHGKQGELDAEQRPAGMELSGRVVLGLRALSGSRPEQIPPVRGKDSGKVQLPPKQSNLNGSAAAQPCRWRMDQREMTFLPAFDSKAALNNR
jgi:hypothetical protein